MIPSPTRAFVAEVPLAESATSFMSETIFVKDLAIHAFHGVMRHEARIGQVFRLDLLLEVAIAAALRSDKLKDTVDYDQVVKTASKAFCARRYQLVEAAAGAVANALLESCPKIRTVCVTVHKPHAPIAATIGDVGVIIRRART
jgi:7,8-dihydroneopterin aldolase/epimerase/oxygenase